MTTALGFVLFLFVVLFVVYLITYESERSLRDDNQKESKACYHSISQLVYTSGYDATTDAFAFSPSSGKVLKGGVRPTSKCLQKYYAALSGSAPGSSPSLWSVRA